MKTVSVTTHTKWKKDEFPNYLKRRVEMEKGIGLSDWYVPETTYWFIKDNRPVGMSKLRHFLNEKLWEHGGHIGFCIRPSEWGKGYGNIILELTLEKAKELGIREVLITCDATNIRSRRVIENNGGTLEKEIGNMCRYWVIIDWIYMPATINGIFDFEGW